MANCYNDCIHSFVCQYVNHDEYPSVQQLKDDCRYCNIGTDVVPKSEVERLQEDVDRLNEINEGLVRELSELRKQIEIDKRSKEIDRFARRRLGDFL